MAGNVSEWVNDWYDAGYYGKSEPSDPKGPCAGVPACAEADERVLRGGSWMDDEAGIRTSRRDKAGPTWFSAVAGFRCAFSDQ
jgi:formylglycine-generating enzyme required for sulfatase activity